MDTMNAVFIFTKFPTNTRIPSDDWGYRLLNRTWEISFSRGTNLQCGSEFSASKPIHNRIVLNGPRDLTRTHLPNLLNCPCPEYLGGSNFKETSLAFHPPFRLLPLGVFMRNSRSIPLHGSHQRTDSNATFFYRESPVYQTIYIKTAVSRFTFPDRIRLVLCIKSMVFFF